MGHAIQLYCGESCRAQTTLLDVLASRKNVGVISGDVLMNGRPVGPDFQRGCAYAEQLVRLPIPSSPFF